MLLTRLDDCTCQVFKSIKSVYPTSRDQYAWKRYLRIYGGCTRPFWGATEKTLHSSVKLLTEHALDNFDNTDKKYF